MEFENLPALWRTRIGSADAATAELAAQIVDRSRSLAAGVRRRDRLETVISLAIAPLFAAVVVLGTSATGRLGAAILTASCLFIPIRLAHARRLFRPAGPDLSLRAFLGEERERLLAQRRLLRTVLWWYLLPLGAGVVLLFGSKAQWLGTAVYSAVVIALYWAIHRANQKAIATQLEPRLADVDGMLRAIADE